MIEDNEDTVHFMFTIPTHKLEVDTILKDLLKCYLEVFKKLIGLPSLRDHKYIIPLKERTQLISLRLYMYSSLQKYVVEKMVSEMIET